MRNRFRQAVPASRVQVLWAVAALLAVLLLLRLAL
jgi:hypothetical protein